jgi:predicted dehydrogenase
MVEKVRVGFIGAGWWATAYHLPQLAARDDVEMSALCRLGGAELTEVRDRFGFRFATEDYRELLEQPLDAVVVSSPHGLHYQHARAALEAGLHVMVEKPMTLKASEAWELVDLARARNLHVLVPYGNNYKPFVEEAARLLADGAIGTIEYVLCHMASPVRSLLSGGDFERDTHHQGMYSPDPNTWANPTVSGGGYGHAQLTHGLGMLFFLTPLRAERVYCEMSAPGAAVELYDAITVRFRDGVIGVISGAGAVPGGNHSQVDVRIFGSEGMLLLDLERPRVEIRRHDGNNVGVAIRADQEEAPRQGPPHRFIELIRGLSDRNNSTGEVGARVVEVLDAAYRSAVSGQPALTTFCGGSTAHPRIEP